MKSMSRTLNTLIFAGLALGASVAPIRAQAPPRPVLISMPVIFPDIDARAIIVRERGRDVIVLRTGDVSAETLGMALMVLNDRRDDELHPTMGQMIPITGYAYTTPLQDEDRLRLERLVVRLGRRPVTDLGTLGAGRWIEYRSR